MALDLKELEKQLDEALEKETPESLAEWLGSKRQKAIALHKEQHDGVFDGCVLTVAKPTYVYLVMTGEFADSDTPISVHNTMKSARKMVMIERKKSLKKYIETYEGQNLKQTIKQFNTTNRFYVKVFEIRE